MEETLRQALILTGVFSLVPLMASMCVGFFVSVMQAATQIQEQTLSFVPKLLCVVLVVYFGSPRALELFQIFFEQAFFSMSMPF